MILYLPMFQLLAGTGLRLSRCTFNFKIDAISRYSPFLSLSTLSVLQGLEEMGWSMLAEKNRGHG